MAGGSGWCSNVSRALRENGVPVARWSNRVGDRPRGVRVANARYGLKPYAFLTFEVWSPKLRRELADETEDVLRKKGWIYERHDSGEGVSYRVHISVYTAKGAPAHLLDKFRKPDTTPAQPPTEYDCHKCTRRTKIRWGSNKVPRHHTAQGEWCLAGGQSVCLVTVGELHHHPH